MGGLRENDSYCRDLMIGNPELSKMGFGEEGKGHNALLGGFQGQRQWTDFYPTGDFTETILNTSFDWNGIKRGYLYLPLKMIV